MRVEVSIVVAHDAHSLVGIPRVISSQIEPRGLNYTRAPVLDLNRLWRRVKLGANMLFVSRPVRTEVAPVEKGGPLVLRKSDELEERRREVNMVRRETRTSCARAVRSQDLIQSEALQLAHRAGHPVRE